MAPLRSYGSTSLKNLPPFSTLKDDMMDGVSSPSPVVVVEAAAPEHLSAEELLAWCPEFAPILYPYINHGYRTPHASFQRTISTMFEYHNETINIWTHLIGCIWFLLLAYHSTKSFTGTPSDLSLLVLYLLGCATTMMFSTLYHTANSHSLEVCKHCHCFDWAFVAVMIGATNLLMCLSELYCLRSMRVTTGAIILALTSYMFISNYHMVDRWYKDREKSTTITTITTPMDSPSSTTSMTDSTTTTTTTIENPGDYLLVNLLCGLFGVFPLLAWGMHRLISGPTLSGSMTLPGLLTIYACHSGGLLNVLAIPERFFTHDQHNYKIYSHQIFHVLTVIGGTVTWKVYYDFLTWRATHTCQYYP